MKVLIAGCGGQGISIAGQIAREKDVTGITCTDLDVGRAKLLADNLKSLNAKLKLAVHQVDLCKSADLAKVASDVDVIVNTAFPEANIPILQACLEVHAHYIDLASFPFAIGGIPREQTMEGLLDFDQKAKEAGITAISNIGNSPGFTDIAAHYVVDHLDTVDTVNLKWFDKLVATDLVATWWAAGIMGEWFDPPGPIVWDKGEVKVVSLINTAQEWEFPDPIGKGWVLTATFHPELFTVSKYCPEVTGKTVNYVELKGGIASNGWALKDILIEIIRRATVKSPVVEKASLGQMWAKEFIQPVDFKKAFDAGIVKNNWCAVSAEVTGEKDGMVVRHALDGVVDLKEAQERVPWASAASYMVGMPGAIATLMLGRDEIQAKGVSCAWVIDKPKDFLKESERRGIRWVERITKSWM